MWTVERLHEKRAEILEAAARHGARNVRVFGSVARGEAREDSDVDFLVELEPGRSLFDLAHFWGELEDILGCKVDVATEGGLHPVLEEAIASDVQPL